MFFGIETESLLLIVVQKLFDNLAVLNILHFTYHQQESLKFDYFGGKL